MEKVNVYDWDKTIFPKDSTVTFYFWCILRYPKVLKALPAALKLLPAYFKGQDQQNRHQGGLLRLPALCAGHRQGRRAVLERAVPPDQRLVSGPAVLRRYRDLRLAGVSDRRPGEASGRAAAGLPGGQIHRQDGRGELLGPGEGAIGCEKPTRRWRSRPSIPIPQRLPLAELADVAWLVKGEKLLPW